MYKNEKKLLYPVNVGRNIARESSPTLYVFPSDIELYPSPNLPVKFLEMIRRRDQPALYKPNPKVFVLSIFEVDEKSQPPNNKTRLVRAPSSSRRVASSRTRLACYRVRLGQLSTRERERNESVYPTALLISREGRINGASFDRGP